MKKNRIKYLWIAAAALIILYGCGGGFGVDDKEARELGPAIFGPDSLLK